MCLVTAVATEAAAAIVVAVVAVVIHTTKWFALGVFFLNYTPSQIVFIVWMNVRTAHCTIWWVWWVRNRNFSLLRLFNVDTATASCYCSLLLLFCLQFIRFSCSTYDYIMDMEQIHRQPTNKYKTKKNILQNNQINYVAMSWIKKIPRI